MTSLSAISPMNSQRSYGGTVTKSSRFSIYRLLWVHCSDFCYNTLKRRPGRRRPDCPDEHGSHARSMNVAVANPVCCVAQSVCAIGSISIGCDVSGSIGESWFYSAKSGRLSTTGAANDKPLPATARSGRANAIISSSRWYIDLEAENAALRHQLIVLRRKVQGRVRLANTDRWFFIQLYRWFPSILQVSFPKIPSGLESHRKAESSHH